MSYVVVVALVATLVGALVAHGLPAVPDRISAAVCSVTGGRDCAATSGVAAPGDTASPRDPAAAPGDRGRPTGLPADPGPAAGDGADDRLQKNDGNCRPIFDNFCGAVDGVRLGIWDASKDVWGSVTLNICLAGLCGFEKLQEKQLAILQLVTHPIDSGKAMWKDTTEPIRHDWETGHEYRAVNRTVPTILGMVFGSRGLGAIGKLGKVPDPEGGKVDGPKGKGDEDASDKGGAPSVRQVDLKSPEMTERFLAAPVFQKKAIVTVDTAKGGEEITTFRPDGSVETVNIAKPADKIITNPPRDGRPGERYITTAENLSKRYDDIGGGRYRAKGVLRAVRNPYGQDVEIVAPWGERMSGEPDCWFVAQVDPAHPDVLTADRYIIFPKAFADDFEPWAGPTS